VSLLILVDDGLKNYVLAHDFEIMVIDGECHFGNGCWLPTHTLQEGIDRLHSVDAVVISGAQVADPPTLNMQLQAKEVINIVSDNY